MERILTAVGPDSDGIRSVSEVVTKTIILHFVTSFIVGHLNDIQLMRPPARHNLPRNSSRNPSRPSPHRFLYSLTAQIVAFNFCPALPLAQFIRRLMQVTSRIYQRGWQRSGGFVYNACACMGMHAVLGRDIRFEREDTQSVPLTGLKKPEAQLIQEPYDTKWWGRLVVLLALAAQTVGTLVLLFRRVQRSVAWEIDYHNIQIVIGSVTAVITSLIIHFFNRVPQWVHPPEDAWDQYAEEVSKAWASPGPGLVLSNSALSWDIEAAIIVQYALLSFIQVKQDLRWTDRYNSFYFGFLRGCWEIILLVGSVWLPVVHMLLHAVPIRNDFVRYTAAVLYGLRYISTYTNALTVLFGLHFASPVVDLVQLKSCPTACAAENLRLFWKDPLENKLFVL